jgi:hypothetical protein
MRLLSKEQTGAVLRRFPNFANHYEKGSESYRTCGKGPTTNLEDTLVVDIPYGKKGYLWFTFYLDSPYTCLYLELDKSYKIYQVFVVSTNVAPSLALGTIFYVINRQPKFVIENIYMYSGVLLTRVPMNMKLGIIQECYEKHYISTDLITLPIMYMASNEVDETTSNEAIKVHHKQYRSLSQFTPFINVMTNQQNKNTTFWVMADPIYDIYHLYSLNNPTEKYDGACLIPNFKTSIWMNSLFRTIRENDNTDLIEESDDGEDDEGDDVMGTRFTNVEKRILIECTYNAKHKKWIPLGEPNRGAAK